MSTLTVIAIFAVLIFIGPAFSIMALNALFGLGIELTFGTWFAMTWVHMVIGGSSVSKK